MAVTKSRAADRAEVRRGPGRSGGWRLAELGWTAAAALLVGAGLYLVYQAKAPILTQAGQGLTSKTLLNLNDLGAREDLLPALRIIPDSRQRQEIARKIYYTSGGLSNVGRIRGVLTADQFRQLKPLFVVRRPEQFRRAFLSAGSALFFAAFLLTHLWWSVRGFRGDQTFLPAILLLTGAGLILMISLRDPVRDNLLFVDFAQGVVGGCIAARRGQPDRFRAALRQAELRAAAGELRAFGAADAVRLRAGNERRQGQPVRVPAGGADPRAAGAVPGRILRAALGRAAPRARDARRGWPRSPAGSTFRRWSTRSRCWSR